MLKPYDGYKETDQLWLDNAPNHWNMIKIKHLFVERVMKGFPSEPLLVASQNMGVVPKDVYRNRTVEATKDLYLLKLVEIGDFVISLRSFQGGIEYAYYRGIISPAYTIITPKSFLTANFFRHLAKSKTFIELLQMCVTGIREGQNIDYSKLKNYRLPVPPQEEQDQIVKYLDWQTSKINILIKAKKKQIELLKEQKQAVINKAVTKGLDDNVPMKDSGVEWLGEVPEHWEVNRLKRFCKVNASISNLTKAYSDNDKLVFLPMESVTVDGKIDCSLKRPFKEIKSGYSSFAKHDVIIAKITPCFENGKGACLDGLETEIGYGTTELITIRGYNNILPKYLYLVTITQHFRLNGEEGMTGSAGQKRIPTNFVANFIQGIPPLEEQQAIVTYLEEKTALIDKAIAVIGKEIELVSEYKISLISSVTTGKVDVRDVVVPEFEFVEDEVSDMVEELEADMHDSD